MKRKFGAMALALSMGLSLTNGVLAADFEDVDESGASSFDTVETTSRNLSKVREAGNDDLQSQPSPLATLSLDKNLEDYLLLKYPEKTTVDDWNNTASLDITAYNETTDDETPLDEDTVKRLNDLASQITSLSGIEKLSKLRSLFCYRLTGLEGASTLEKSTELNNITINECGKENANFSLVLSDLINLKGLWMSSNPGLNSISYTISEGKDGTLDCISLYNLPNLSSLDLKDCKNLETFSCTATPLTSLDLSNNTKLKKFYCSGSKVSKLDFTKNAELVNLDCSDNSSLELLSLDATTNTKLQSVYCPFTKIKTLDLMGFKNLQSVTCYNNNDLVFVTVQNCPNLVVLYNYSTPALKSIDVRGCPKLDKGTITHTSGLNIADDPVETKYDYTVKGIEDSYWQTGSAIEPKPVLKYGTYTLKEGKDYKLSYKNNVDGPKGSVTITGKGVFGGVNKTAYFKIEKTDRMNRLYNPNSGEHFYTASTAEKNHLVKLGRRSEGIGWTTPKTSKAPVYRLYNPNAGDHHYTMSLAEKDMLVSKGWCYEGIAFYSGDSDGVAVYRQYNPNAKAGAHNYTSSFGEHKYLINVGWNGEGVAWYGVSND